MVNEFLKIDGKKGKPNEVSISGLETIYCKAVFRIGENNARLF